MKAGRLRRGKNWAAARQELGGGEARTGPLHNSGKPNGYTQKARRGTQKARRGTTEGKTRHTEGKTRHNRRQDAARNRRVLYGVSR